MHYHVLGAKEQHLSSLFQAMIKGCAVTVLFVTRTQEMNCSLAILANNVKLGGCYSYQCHIFFEKAGHLRDTSTKLVTSVRCL